MTDKKPLLALIGFWARGNIGDEAMLVSIVRNLEKEFDFLIVLDEHGAKSGFWDWFPYNKYRRTHIGNVHLSGYKDLVGILVGGGGLGIGYGAAQALVQKCQGGKLGLVGVDIGIANLSSEGSLEGAKLYYNIFDYVSFRSQVSHERASEFNIENDYGVDWVFGLQRREQRKKKIWNFFPRKKKLLIVVREFDMGNAVLVEHFNRIVRLIDGINNYEKILCPFAPEDLRLYRDHPEIISVVDNVVTNCHTVDECLDLFAEVDAVISFGRLHPLIFAKLYDLPAVGFDIDVLEERRLAYPTKVVAMCSELGYKCYGYYELNILSSDFLVDLLNEQQSNQGKTSAFFKKRLEVQVKKVVDLFSKKSSN